MTDMSELFQDTVRDIYSSEQQIMKTLPEMYQKAQGSRLRETFALHLEQTTQHLQRIEQICLRLGFAPTGKFCNGTKGMVQEAKENIEEFGNTSVSDVSLIANAQKIEHYEICNYRTVILWMQALGIDSDLIGLMERTLGEEEETDEVLRSIAAEEMPRSSLPYAISNRAELF